MAKSQSTESVDPTANVLKLVEEASSRLDALRVAEQKRVDQLSEAETRRVDQLSDLRDRYGRELRVAEAARIDAIRAVDVNAVSVASERAADQAAVLANQVAASAETLRALVATTASAVAQQLTQASTQFTERLALLEKANYEGAGKTQATDPMISNLLTEMKTMRESIQEGKGRQGISTPLLVGIATAAGGLVSYLIRGAMGH